MCLKRIISLSWKSFWGGLIVGYCLKQFSDKTVLRDTRVIPLKKEYKVMTTSSKCSMDDKLTQSRARFVAHSRDFKIDSLLASHEF